jgi:hypothetical protein
MTFNKFTCINLMAQVSKYYCNTLLGLHVLSTFYNPHLIRGICDVQETEPNASRVATSPLLFVYN